MTATADLQSAERDAEQAAEQAGVRVQALHSPAEMSDAAAVLRGIWSDNDTELVHPTLMAALAHGGNYTAGAFHDDEIVAVCIGFFAVPLGRTLHSHVTGVAAGHAGRGIGTALKLHQRLWCLERDIDSITWTFDPLVARNAYFNLHHLGIRVAAYLTDFYGQMYDAVNKGQATDRLLVRWQLRDPLGARTPEPTEAIRTVAVPPDIERLRRTDPGAAAAWRATTRRELAKPIDAGWQVVDFERGTGYVLTRRDTP